MKKIELLLHDLRLRNEAVRQELERLYPVGTEIMVLVQINHVRPSRVTVVAHPAGQFGELRVKFESGHATTIPYSAIVKL